MSAEEYLWDFSGDADPQIEFFERFGAELGYDAQLAEARRAVSPPPAGARRGRALPFIAAAAAVVLVLAGGLLLTRSDAAMPSSNAPLPGIRSLGAVAPKVLAHPDARREVNMRWKPAVISCALAGGCANPPAVAPQPPRKPAKRKPVAAAPPAPAVPPASGSDLRVQAFDADAQACFRAELEQSPGLSGRAVVKFSIEADGRVAAPHVTGAHFSVQGAGERVAACIERKVEGWRFPAPTNAPLNVQLPLVFR